MSIRSLIEINHDFCDRLDSPAFVAALQRYLRSGNRECAEDLDLFGVRLVANRHHSADYYIVGRHDGFPARYQQGPSA